MAEYSGTFKGLAVGCIQRTRHGLHGPPDAMAGVAHHLEPRGLLTGMHHLERVVAAEEVLRHHDLRPRPAHLPEIVRHLSPEHSESNASGILTRVERTWTALRFIQSVLCYDLLSSGILTAARRRPPAAVPRKTGLAWSEAPLGSRTSPVEP